MNCTTPTHRPLAASAVLGAAVSAALAVGTVAPAHAAQAGQAGQAPAAERQRFAYAVLQAPGWSEVVGDSPADARVSYVTEGGNEVTLAWHSSAESRRAYTTGEKAGATTMDGDRSPVFVSQGVSTAVGPRVNQQFLTLSSDSVSTGQLEDLAGQVSRTAYATLEGRGWIARADNVPSDDKLEYVGPQGASVVLNWRPADGSRSKFLAGDRVGTTTIDGVRAPVIEDPAGSGYLTVVGRVSDGRFLTLATTTASLKTLDRLAPGVHRR